MTFRNRIIGAFGAALLLTGTAATSPALAHEVSPMRVFLTPADGVRSSVVTIVNDRDSDLPIEIEFRRRIVAPDGTQTFENADEQFVAFPPQVLIGPKGTQAIRFEYIGDPDLAVSQSYVLQVKEVPVLPENFSGVLTVYNFGVAVYLTADGARAELERPVVVSRDDSQVRFQIQNTGTDYGFLSQRIVRLRAGGETVTLDPEQVAEQIENPIIPPNSTREFALKTDGLPPGEVTIEVGAAR
ncbi:MAG: molecular chaperone [Brevundimonas sp.]|uniref:fimbrial biogenesis chaperone n=1 Tax=Brevundimonas sp. TaxID=1871086 RepID=UPI001A21D65D|nr:hypothetical protein [Brevundimonas sp.]MBJ7447905.1 molecular chaperone [Brevundimonas sp.]